MCNFASLVVVTAAIVGVATPALATHGSPQANKNLHRRRPAPQDYSYGSGASGYNMPGSEPAAAPESSASFSASSSAMEMAAHNMASTTTAHDMGGAKTTAPAEKCTTMKAMTTGGDAHPTSSAGGKYESASWKGSSSAGMYDNCVQMCQAKYGGGMMATSTMSSGGKAQPTEGAGKGGNMSMTPLVASSPWEVVVAPMKGDLRMIPFNLNVQPNQKITYKWGAGPHTVTESDSKSICNKSTSPTAFASGLQNASFTYELLVNDATTKFYYCSVPTHCQKGMFGIINGAVSTDPVKSFGGWGPMEASKDKAFGAQWNATMDKVKGTDAEKWGDMLDMSQMPDWAQPMAGYSILATREYYAANPRLLAALNNGTSDNSTSSSSNSTASSGNSTEPSATSNSTDDSSATSGDSASPSASPNALTGLSSGTTREMISSLSLVITLFGSVLLLQ
ncbi:BQ2448_4699 [Microbotryum intermedium]|uniref:BQ2448_4699 protein n=1 Tax=Microbotryum intermedium TaxID=269621 RepID=A0A238FFM7_9BASI|nr:BQ2448_4699 [Microbotryum intermedium]